MRSSAWTARFALSGLLILSLGAALPAGAQDAPEQTPEQKKEAKRQAKEARIEDYLRQKEERRARREQEHKEEQALREATEEELRREQEAELALQEQQERDEALAAATATTATQGDTKTKLSYEDPGPLPKELARAQKNVRQTSLGQDPTVQRYLEMVDRQAASPRQLGAMGNFLAEAGMTADAVAYYDVALRLDPDDAVLWINLGTLQRQLGNYGNAASAYGKALGIEPNHAAAHYNLGAAYDALGKYDQAIEEYKVALRLDPSLGDPAVNPQAANNRSLTAVQLLLYQEQIGAAGLPLLDVPGGEVAAEAEASD